MDFKEWFESRDDIGCLIGLEGYAAKKAWNARQAEIDALKARVLAMESCMDEAIRLIDEGNSWDAKELLK